MNGWGLLSEVIRDIDAIRRIADFAFVTELILFRGGAVIRIDFLPMGRKFLVADAVAALGSSDESHSVLDAFQTCDDVVASPFEFPVGISAGETPIFVMRSVVFKGLGGDEECVCVHNENENSPSTADVKNFFPEF